MMPTNPLMGSRVVARSDDTPVVGTFHMVGGTWFINSGAHVMRLLQKRTWGRISRFLSVSTAARDFEWKYFKVNSEVSPNMVEMEHFSKGEAKPFLQGQNGTIIFLGRLVERKGAIHLLKAVRILQSRQQLDGVRVNICGDGELRKELEDFVATHQLQDNVFFHGFIDPEEKNDFLASADVAVYPSTGGEAFGIVLIEAMATGKTVVLGGDNSGYRTVLGGREELLFDPTNHAVLADKLLHYLQDKKAAQSAIDWQTEEVRQYDVNVVGQEMVDIYRAEIAAKRTHTSV
jgi:phosphatidylinositol alpha-mannosyltransferase